MSCLRSAATCFHQSSKSGRQGKSQCLPPQARRTIRPSSVMKRMTWTIVLELAWCSQPRISTARCTHTPGCSSTTLCTCSIKNPVRLNPVQRPALPRLPTARCCLEPSEARNPGLPGLPVESKVVRAGFMGAGSWLVELGAVVAFQRGPPRAGPSQKRALGLRLVPQALGVHGASTKHPPFDSSAWVPARRLA